MNTLLLWEGIAEGFLGIMMLLDAAIYSLISSAYRIFMAVASARILSSSAYTQIANKVYIVIGVVMLFVLSYAIIKAIIDPDIAKGKDGISAPQILKRLAIAVLGLALTPVVFNLIYQGQSLLMEQDVLAKLFFRAGDDTISVPGLDKDIDPDSYLQDIGGAMTAASVWQAFFYADGEPADQIKVDADELYLKSAGAGVMGVVIGALTGIGVATSEIGIGFVLLGIAAALACFAVSDKTAEAAENISEYTKDGEVSLQDAYNIAASSGNFYVFYSFLDNVVEEENIQYTWLVSSIVGGIVAFSFISFAVDMGIRAVKLAYYQIIAPIPLLLQIIPSKKAVWDEYLKSVLSTFMEVFIRISVVYICVFLICHLTDLFSSGSALWANERLNTPETVLAMAALILGIVIFAKNAPKIITQTLGIKADVKFGLDHLKQNLADGGIFSAGAIAGAGITRGANALTSAWDKRDRTNAVKSVGSALGAGALGVLGGAARATKNEFFGENHKQSKTFGDAKRSAGKAAQEQGDRMSDIEDWKKKTGADAKGVAGVHAAISGVGNDIGNKVSNWAAGTVSTEREEAQMKFGSALDDLKGNLRAEAEKKDAITKQYKQEYDNLSSQTISEFRKGWDETSFNAAIRDKLTAEKSDYDAKSLAERNAADELHRREGVLAQARAHGANAATIATLTQDVNDAQADLATAHAEVEASARAYDAKRVTATEEVTAIAKRSEDELAKERADLEVRRQAAKDAYEAAADAFIYKKALEQDSNTYRDIQKFLSENGDYIINHGSDVFEINGTKMTVKEIVGNAFGDQAATDAKFDRHNAAFGSQNTFVLKDAGGTSVTYTYDVTRDPRTGEVLTEKYVGSNGTVYTADDFFQQVFVNGTKKGKVDSKTAVSTASDQGKKGSVHIRNTTYAEKVKRKRAQQKDKH